MIKIRDLTLWHLIILAKLVSAELSVLRNLKNSGPCVITFFRASFSSYADPIALIMFNWASLQVGGQCLDQKHGIVGIGE